MAFPASNRDDVVQSAAAQLRAHHTQRFVRGGVLLRPQRANQKQKRSQRSPHAENCTAFRALSIGFYREYYLHGLCYCLKGALESAHVLRVVMKMRKVELSSHPANLALLRNCVRDFLNGYPFSEKQRLLMVLGVDEACTNVIRYAYRLREDQLISLRMEGLRKCVRMRLRDYRHKVFQ